MSLIKKYFGNKFRFLSVFGAFVLGLATWFIPKWVLLLLLLLVFALDFLSFVWVNSGE